jgi:hypothetical protein
MKIVDSSLVNYDKQSYKGNMILIKRIYDQLSQNKAIYVNIVDFKKQQGLQGRINYLLSLGN